MKSTGATVAETDPLDRLKSWGAHHGRVFNSTLRELLANPVSSLMTWLVIGIALSLPAILYVVLENVAMVSGGWGGEPRFSLYLDKQIAVADARRLSEEIRQIPEVKGVTFISSEDALKQFQDRSGFGEVLSTLERNPLPHVIEISPLDPDPVSLGAMVATWRENPAVDRVSVDLDWLERLFALIRFGERFVFSLSLVLGLDVLLVMGNTIRLAIENRRQEIEIVKLVGGTDAFVRRPFLYLGFWYGLGGAVIAFLLLQISLSFLAGPVEAIAQSYRDEFSLSGPGPSGYLVLIVGGAGLGVAGAVLAVSRHLSDIEPN